MGKEGVQVVMVRNAAIRTLIAVILLIGAWAGLALAQELPVEPEEQFLVSEDVNYFTGFYTREYSLAGNGIVDYRTARQVLHSEYHAYSDPVVETKEYPLFYWYDVDQDGHFAMWIDREVEGCRCDIVPYQAKFGE